MTKPQRLALKLHARSPKLAHADLEACVALFHRYIQQQRLPGLLLDVADYAHVQDGPGVILIGHDVDYGVDLGAGRAGLLVTRKRNRELALAELLRDTLRMAFAAAAALEADAPRALALDTGSLEIRVPDRLALRNDAEGATALERAARPLLAQVYGAAPLTLSHRSAADPRALLSLAVEAKGAGAAGELLAALGGRPT